LIFIIIIRKAVSYFVQKGHINEALRCHQRLQSERKFQVMTLSHLTASGSKTFVQSWSSHEIIVFVLCNRYDAGDHVGIYPTNDLDLVEKIGQLLETDLDTVISLDNVDGN